jgi:hypothetical protein
MTEKNLTMNEIVCEIRSNLKNELPGYKFSVTRKHYDSITVALMESPESPFCDEKVEGTKFTHKGEYAQLNHYCIKKNCNGYHLTDAALELFQKINEISNRRNYDHSDIQSDFFDVNFYFHMNIGKWDKPFKVCKAG